ncbi:DUF6777 domain-containing protein [Kitasatospora hibisci]|uniref:DUF6777 domain-containing protein n=1 Tax=Kitasatospora hibisci TaxID=3369522 RepID=UPI0037543FF7
MSSQPPPSGPPFGPPSGPPSGPLSGPPSGGRSGPPGPPSGPSGPGSAGGAPGGPSGGRPTPWWRSGPKLALVAGTAVLAVVATVLIVNSNSGSSPSDAIPAANEVALQQPSDPGPAPFTPSVETAAVSAPQPTTGATTTTAAASPTGIHSVQGSSAGLYAGTMSKPSCDVEKLISMTSTGDSGRAWASAQGIQQSAIPSYMRSLTSAYLRVDTRVTNHGYKGGAAVAYQSVLQAGTSVLVDAQGVPRVRCGCGNPLKPPELVSDAKYTGKSWTGFQPSQVIIVVAAPQPVREIVLVNVETGGWFARVTGQIKVEDTPVKAPKELAPGIPPAEPMEVVSPSASVSGSPSGSTSVSSTSGSPSGPSSPASTATKGPTTGGTSTPPASSGPPTTATATATATVTSTATAPTTATATGTATTTATATATATTTVSSGSATATTTATGTTGTTPATATCATISPSTLPPCRTASGTAAS